MQTVWESANESAKVVDCGDRYTVVMWSNGRSKMVAEYWKDGSAQEALHFAIEEAQTVSKVLLG